MAKGIGTIGDLCISGRVEIGMCNIANKIIGMTYLNLKKSLQTQKMLYLDHHHQPFITLILLF